MKYKVSLRIFSDKLTPEHLSELIGLSYDQKRDIGQPRGKNLAVEFKENIWILDSRIGPTGTLDIHINELLKRIYPFKSKMKELSKKCEIVCQCVVEGDENPVLYFSKLILHGLSEIGAELDIDTYIV